MNKSIMGFIDTYNEINIIYSKKKSTMVYLLQLIIVKVEDYYEVQKEKRKTDPRTIR